MRRKRAVVTGGAGFLGSHLCERLLDDGIEVLCLDNFCTGTPVNVEHLLERDGFRLVRVDVTDYLHVSGNVDVVLHFAFPHPRLTTCSCRSRRSRWVPSARCTRWDWPGRSTPGSSSPRPRRLRRSLVHPQPETYWGNVNPVGPRGVYDEAKRFAEALTMACRNSHGVDTAIARIFNTFGPRMRPRDGRAIPTFIRQALANQPITVAGDGMQTRSVCYVDDLIEGIARLLHSNHFGPMNIGNPQEFTVLRLAELIRHLTGSHSPIEFVPRPQDDPMVRQPDITLAKDKLAWEPKVDVERGLLRTIAWFRQHPRDELRALVR
jgi:dTDP-glucose 4,6-dehydratase